MSLTALRADHFRCLDAVDIQPDPHLNLITGPNASGKTSLLESIFYLGRGRSFRAGRSAELIEHGAPGFTVYGETANGTEGHRLGVELGRSERRIQLDGQSATTGELAAVLPVQVIDPEIHLLIQGGPEQRRRFLDWGVFHVEPHYLETWRRYRKALRQRNAALRRGESPDLVSAWDPELVEEGHKVDQMRAAFADRFFARFNDISSEYLPFDSKCSYIRGWKPDIDLAAALAGSVERDRAMQATQVGPHRADLRLEHDTRTVRHNLSRGQQKLLAATLVIAQMHFVAEARERKIILLVDDPVAELDADHRQRLFELLRTVPAQLFIAALEPLDLPWETDPLMFHVEHGKLAPLV